MSTANNHEIPPLCCDRCKEVHAENGGIREYRRRYEVQIANTVFTAGRDIQGRWDFGHGFHTLDEARNAADRLSEDYRWVRVVDTLEHVDPGSIK